MEDTTTTTTTLSSLLCFLTVLGRRDVTACIQTPLHSTLILLALLAELATFYMAQMQTATSSYGHRACSPQSPLSPSHATTSIVALEEGYAIQVNGHVLSLCHDVLKVLLHLMGEPSDMTSDASPTSGNTRRCNLLRREAAAFNDALPSDVKTTLGVFTLERMGLGVLQTLTANLRRLVVSRVDPMDVGIGVTPLSLPAITVPNTYDLGASTSTSPTVLAAPSSFSTSTTLSTMLTTLEELIVTGGKASDPLFPLSLQAAAAAVEVGMEALYLSREVGKESVGVLALAYRQCDSF